ncbi:MAG: hypothetical protein K5930_04175 [Treponemataceae bacterium]|nr:hypothetical protein [Treponemataceae bacterium]
MSLDELRDDITVSQKKGLPFIITSVIIWLLIAVVTLLKLPVMTRNLLVFCCSCPLMPIAWLVGKAIKVDIFSKENPLGKLGFLFTLNQLIYLLIVMWAFREAPDKMVMIYAMIFGAHLLPYSWLYKSKAYIITAIVIPLISLVLEYLANTTILALTVMVIEIIFSVLLLVELRKKTR